MQITPHSRPALEQNFLLGLQNNLYTDKSYGTALFKLNEIVLRYAVMDDTISNRLRAWALKCFMLCSEDATDETIMGNIETQFLALEIILRNNLNPDYPIIENPYFDGEWLWEKSDLDNYMGIHKISPYNKRPLHATPHPFAKAILEWAKEFSEIITYSFEEQPDVVSTIQDIAAIAIVEPRVSRELDAIAAGLNPSLRKRMQLVKYLHLAEVASVHSKGNEENLQMITAIADECEATVVCLKQLHTEEIARAKAVVQQQREIAQNQLKELGHDYKQKEEIFKTNLAIAQQELAVERTNTHQKQAMLLSMEQELARQLAEQVALNANYQLEQQKNEQKQGAIESLNARIQTTLADQEVQAQRHLAAKDLLANNITALKQQIGTEKGNALEKQVRVEALENQIASAIAAQEIQQQQYELQQRQLRQVLEAQLAQSVAQHAAARQQELNNHMAEIARVEQHNQQELNQRLQAVAESNQVQVTQLQAQINSEQQQRQNIQAHANNLQSQLTSQTQTASTYYQQVVALTATVQQQNARVAVVEKKVHKAKKRRWKFW